MNIGIIFSIIINIIFGAVAIIFSFREEKITNEFKANEKGKIMAMIKSLDDGVFMLDTHQKLIIINEAAKQFLHISKDDVTAADIFMPLANKFDLAAKVQESIEQNKTIEEKEITLNVKTLQIFIHPVTDIITRKIIGVSVLLHDISLEKNLARHKEDFTNMVVHEMRAPLTGIKGSSELLLKQRSSLSPQEQEKMLNIINSQARRMLDEVSTLLDAAKLEAGKFTIQKSPTDMVALIQERVEFFKPQALNKHITLTSQLDEQMPQVSIDSFRIGQVINNLLSNSLKFTPENGHIIIGGKLQNEVLIIWVSDNGQGIPREKQKNLFAKFYQANADENIAATAKENRPHGTGLGLYILKGIVEAHGGTIFLESDENVGTTISFTIPLTDQILTEKDQTTTIQPQTTITQAES